MSAWQQTPTGYYPGQPAPPQPGFYTDGDGYPKQQGYPQQPGYPQQQGQGFPPPPYSGGGFVPPVPPTFAHFPPPEPDPDMHSAFPEDPLSGGNFGFTEKSIRRAFIRKVYAILMCQLACTLAIGTVFATHDGAKLFVRQNPGVWWFAFILAFATLLIMSCFDNARRTAPLNYIFLLIFTVSQSFLVGCVVSFKDGESVVWAVGICTVVCLGLTIFAFQTKWDFTMMGGFLFVSVLILLVFSLVLMFFPSRIGTLIYASIGALIFSLYIVYDTQIMIGGSHKYAISPEEYIFAALNLYIDIINLFLYILTIISNKD